MMSAMIRIEGAMANLRAGIASGAPAETVRVMNAYLGAMTEEIEARGGMVDKYIGDAIVALFGAPLNQPDHAARRVRTDHQGGGAVVEQQHDRAAGLQADQVRPLHADRTCPQPAGTHPIHQHRRRRHFAVRHAQIVAVQLQAMIARSGHQGAQPQLQRQWRSGARVVRPGSARSRRIRCGTGNRGQLPAGGTLPPFGLEGAGRTIGRTQIT